MSLEYVILVQTIKEDVDLPFQRFLMKINLPAGNFRTWLQLNDEPFVVQRVKLTAFNI